MYMIFRDLAIIIVAAKFCGIVASKLKAPQVVGEIIAGLLIGPSVFGIVSESDFMIQMAEIGVVLLMFFAGLETNLKDLKKTGFKALLIAIAGVVVPLVGGSILYFLYYGMAPFGSDKFYTGIFIGVIMTATSVSITVATLQELGKLKESLGTTIMGAAIIDDVIGIIVLTLVIGFKNPDVSPMNVVKNTGLFFLLAALLGVGGYQLFRFLDEKYPHTRRIPIFGLVLCLALAYVAETQFGIADITGAYVAGIILCNIQDSEYIARKIDISSYMIFAPVFFASIGIKTSLQQMNPSLLVFSILFVVVALVGKIIGCGTIARILGIKGKDTLKVGVGMMTRGEVALIVMQKGIDEGMIDPMYSTSVILLIVVSSIITPIILKVLYAEKAAA
ncbi:MAG: cation:proton antiporter [Clostridia bacterium]|nr:cation:proton antiporter [Clostridia bacterium]NCC44992.1 cation:proton antiporter [Clostridia bacterium]